MIDTKIICSCCKQGKSKQDYYSDKNKKNGLGSNCKECIGKRKKQNYKMKRNNFKKRIIQTQTGSIVIPDTLLTKEVFVPRETEVQLSFFDILKEML